VINADLESMLIRTPHQFSKAGLAIDDLDEKVYNVEIYNECRRG
jgi:hypothetical protein